MLLSRQDAAHVYMVSQQFWMPELAGSAQDSACQQPITKGLKGPHTLLLMYEQLMDSWGRTAIIFSCNPESLPMTSSRPKVTQRAMVKISGSLNKKTGK